MYGFASGIAPIISYKYGKKEEVEIKEYGFMTTKNDFDSVIFNVSPFNWETYKVSVRVSKKDKVVYLKDYKKYFYEEVNLFDSGLKVNLNKKKECIVFDEDGNKVIVKVVR